MSDVFIIPRLPGLTDIAAALEAPDGEATMLEGLAEAAAGALGYSIVINLRRPAWNDFEVAVVTGSDAARGTLLGACTTWDLWRDVLVERFRRGTAYFVPDGEYEWPDDVFRYVPPREYGDDEGAWQTGDELFLPLHGSDGRLQGILSLDEPVSGRRPADADLHSLEAAGANIAMALELVHQAAEARRDRAALEHLMRMSTQLGRGGVEETLTAVCGGIRDALGFQVVAAFLLDDSGSAFELRASVGLPPAPVTALARVAREALEPLFTATDGVQEGCVLLTREQASALGVPSDWPQTSTRNGEGPQAWRRHVLAVALVDTAGRLIGAVWADDPEDRLLPGRGVLQAMRTFANQAATGLEAARQLRQLSHMAEHDPLTGLRNRRGLLEEIERTMADTRTVSLLMCDMDHFKRINDRLGYSAGDEAIRRVGAILAAEAERGGVAARLGGEEFALVLPGVTEADAGVVAARVRVSVAAAFTDYPWPQAVSAGVAATTAVGERGDAASLLRLASRALLAAKRLGRDRFVVYDAMVVEGVLRGMEQAGTGSEATTLLIRLAESIDLPEAGTGRHSQAVASLTSAVSAEMGWSDERVERLRLAGLLHDIGTLVVPTEILHKPAGLTAAEWAEIVRHPEAGARMLEQAGMPDVAAWVRAHHERPDGQGYPHRLTGDAIPMEARIVSAADAYEAMTSPRPYQAPLSSAQARDEMRRCAGTQFDPEVVEILLRVIAREAPEPAPRLVPPAQPAADRRSPPRVA